MRAWPVGGDGARPDSTEVGESCWNGTAGGMPVGDSGVSCRQDTMMGVEAISAVTAVTGTSPTRCLAQDCTDGHARLLPRPSGYGLSVLRAVCGAHE